VTPVTNKKAWRISVAASVLLVAAVFVALFGAGFRLFIVKTPSMGTVAPVGTLVAVHPQASYGLGDVITYERNGVSYTHRIVDQTDAGFILKGDINGAHDALPVPASEIVGKVVFAGRYLGFLLEGLPWIILGCAIVFALTLIPRVPPSWRWQIRFVGWSLVFSLVALWQRPWVNMEMLAYAAQVDGVDMHLVNTGIFPVNVVGTLLNSGQDAIVTQTVADSQGRYLVTPELALNVWWFLLLLAICLTPVVASLLIRIEDPAPAETVEAEISETTTEKTEKRRRVGLVALITTASVVLAAIVLQWSTQASMAASLTNSTNTAATRTWFTCQNAEVGTANARFVWGLTATGNQTDLTRKNDGTMTTVKKGTAATADSSSPCPRDTQGSLMLNGATCIYTSATVMGTETYSEEVWFRTTNKSFNGKLMGFAENTVPANQNHYDRHIYIDPTGRVVFGVYPGYPPGHQAVVSSPTGRNYADGAWHHVVATSAPGTISLYLDGALVGTRSDTAGQDAFTGYWMVGCGLLTDWQDATGTPQAFSSYYTGNLRLAAVYDVTLTATQVKEHYQAGTA